MSKSGIIKLHGREYKTVALRVQEFRALHPIAEGWAIVTEPVSIDGDVVLFRAAVVSPGGREVAVGYAEEKRSQRGINSTSALENCETSAIGRALAAAGFGGSEYASADELANALHQQRTVSSKTVHPSWTEDRRQFVDALARLGLELHQVEEATAARGWGAPSGWTSDERFRFLADLRKGAFPELYVPS